MIDIDRSVKSMKNNRGFTLVEMMTVMGIASIVIFISYAAVQIGRQQSEVTETKTIIQENAREGLYRMIQEVRTSKPDQITIAADGDSISFKIPNSSADLADDYTVDWTSAYTIDYDIGGTNSNQLIRTNSSTGATSVLASNVSDLTFSGNSSEPTLVTFTMTMSKDTPSGRTIPFSMTGQAEIRNQVDPETSGDDDAGDDDGDDDDGDDDDGGDDDGGDDDGGDDD